MAGRERIREERRQKVKERGGKDSKEKERHYRKYEKKKKKRESRDKDQQGAPTEKRKSHPDVFKSFKRPPPLLLLFSLPRFFFLFLFLNSTGRNGSHFNRIPLETIL